MSTCCLDATEHFIELSQDYKIII